jgi:hypothetical protein
MDGAYGLYKSCRKNPMTAKTRRCGVLKLQKRIALYGLVSRQVLLPSDLNLRILARARPSEGLTRSRNIPTAKFVL